MEMSKIEEITEQTVISKMLCPFLGNPFDDCYCVRMNSQYIKSAVYYCGNNFEICEIYKNGYH